MNREKFQSTPDILDQYPELKRARNLFIQLFKNRSPLVALNYQGYKLDRVVATIKLVEQIGKVQTWTRSPFLEWVSPPASDDHYDDLVHIGEIIDRRSGNKPKDRKGYRLFAQHKQLGDPPLDTSSNEAAIVSSMVNSIAKELGLDHELAAEVYLLNNRADLSNLDFLARLVLTHGNSNETFLKENTWTRFVRKRRVFGYTSTFQADWVDEGKDAFIVKCISPPYTSFSRGTEEFEPTYYFAKLLKPIGDDQGEVTPVGLRWMPQDSIKRMFEQRKSVPVTGQLKLAPVRA